MRRGPYRRLAVAAGCLICLLGLTLGGRQEARAESHADTALLIIDIQEFYFADGSVPLVDAAAASAQAARLLAHFRAAGKPVVHVGHNAGQGRDFHSDVRPAENELVVMKDEVSCFKGTDLFERLQGLGVASLVICGMQTHMCLEAAARAAGDLGFEVTVIGDACATRDLSYGDRKIVAADVHASTLRTLDGVYAQIMDTETFLSQN